MNRKYAIGVLVVFLGLVQSIRVLAARNEIAHQPPGSVATVSDFGVLSNLEPNVRYVKKGGSDVDCPSTPVCGDGTQAKPYLTIDKAQTAISAVSSGLFTIDIGAGTFSEISTFSWRNNTHYRGAGPSRTQVRRSDSTAIPGTISTGGGNTMIFEELSINNGFTITRPVGAVATGTLTMRNVVQLAGTSTVTGGGTGVSTSPRIDIDLNTYISTLGTLNLNGVGGQIRSSQILNVNISGLTVDGVVDGTGPGSIMSSLVSNLTLDGTNVPPATSTGVATNLNNSNTSTITMKGDRPRLTTVDSFDGRTIHLTGDITSGSPTVTNIKIGGTAITFTPPTGTRLATRGIPNDTLVTGSPGAGQATLGVNATETLVGANLYSQTNLSFLNGALPSYVTRLNSNHVDYTATTPGHWNNSPTILFQALDYLAQDKLDRRILSAQTTTTTLSDVFALTLDDNTSYLARAFVIGTEATGGSRGAYEKNVLAYRDGGAVAFIGTETNISTIESDATWNCQWTSGHATDLKFQCAGNSGGAETVNWKGYVVFEKRAE